ncbi:MAG: hypothetical protein E6Q58_01725 [Niabella sp.]|nr:MAG: hypothetical protein E6Q58_01725 [Niabella sp.]
MNFYKDYDFNLHRLTHDEQSAVALMKQMLQLAAQIDEKQLDRNAPGSNFYPKDVTKEELLDASAKDQSILSPYTVVKRSDDGALYTIPFHKEYAEELKKISDLAKEASALDLEQPVKVYLEKLSQAALDDSWEELENYWLTVDRNKLDFQLAPIEAYLDGILSVKHTFQGSIRYASEKSNFNPEKYIETIKAIQLTNIEAVNFMRSSTIVRVDDVIASAGHHVAVPPRGSNYPNDIKKVAQYGTKLIVHTDNIIAREKGSLIPMLKLIVKPSVLENFTEEDLFAAGIRNVLSHEIAEAFIKYPDTVFRLKDMYFPVRELNSSLIGLKIAANHVLQGALSHKGYEAMLLTLFVGRSFSDLLRNENPEHFSRGLTYYIKGYVAVFNYFLEYGAVTITSDQYLDVNFNKVFACIDQLSTEIEEIKKNGTEVQATEFFEKYEDYKFVDPFRERLKGITFN